MLGFFDAGLLLTNWERDLVPGDKIDGADAVEVLSVRGGDALWTVGGNAIPVLARSRVGNGAVYAYAGASGFSERELGSSGDTLNAADTQLGSYRRLLALLDATGAVPAAKTPPDAAAQRSSGEPAVADTSAVESLFEGPRRGGTYRASVRVFVKSYSHVAFLAGYVLSDGRNGVLHVVGDDGSGALQPRSHGVELHAGGTALSWVQREHAAVVRIPRVVPDGGCFLRPSPRWRTLTWVVSESTQDPFAPYRDRESPLFDLGKELIAQDATAGRLPTSGWQDLPLTGPYREFRTRDESRLGGGCIGRAHIWVDATHGVPKMARFELRFAGRPGVGSWYDVVVLYGDVSWHPDRFVPDAVHAPHVFQPDGEQLRWLRGE
jgi:hypothetical protein